LASPAVFRSFRVLFWWHTWSYCHCSPERTWLVIRRNSEILNQHRLGASGRTRVWEKQGSGPFRVEVERCRHASGFVPPTSPNPPVLSAALAARFHVSRKTIETVCRGETWQHVSPRRAVRRKLRVSKCAQCSTAFKHGVTGSRRLYCDDRRKVRRNACKWRALEEQLRPIVERVVREVLAEMKIPKAGNGAAAGRSDVVTGERLSGGRG
jgi:hypothetical protein